MGCRLNPTDQWTRCTQPGLAGKLHSYVTKGVGTRGVGGGGGGGTRGGTKGVRVGLGWWWGTRGLEGGLESGD